MRAGRSTNTCSALGLVPNAAAPCSHLKQSSSASSFPVSQQRLSASKRACARCWYPQDRKMSASGLCKTPITISVVVQHTSLCSGALDPAPPLPHSQTQDLRQEQRISLRSVSSAVLDMGTGRGTARTRSCQRSGLGVSEVRWRSCRNVSVESTDPGTQNRALQPRSLFRRLRLYQVRSCRSQRMGIDCLVLHARTRFCQRTTP